MTTLTTIAEILAAMGEAGLRLDHMNAVEAGAGNISFSTSADVDLTTDFPDAAPGTPLPWTVPSLAGRTVFVTGSGCRLRDVAAHPHQTVSAFVVDEDGKTGTWYTHPDHTFSKPTSEFNSHLAVHADQVATAGVDQVAVIHAQPPYLVQLSHDRETRTTEKFNRAILRWEPETIVQVPAGIEVLDFMVPGSQELMENNVRALRDHIVVLWSKHGIMVRSYDSPLAAVDKVEYLETGAMYELRNRTDGRGEGLTDDEIRRVIADFNVETTLY
ncbi:MAG: class II aldolase/adducin family protein [Actinomycetaceae bacterium]|nr:class II aldolase/adducin family protein [Actinomycetaceae bacterium]MDU0969928.1 class II aldolase/adducin family protein [Actinomycetaceae bacterium]